MKGRGAKRKIICMFLSMNNCNWSHMSTRNVLDDPKIVKCFAYNFTYFLATLFIFALGYRPTLLGHTTG